MFHKSMPVALATAALAAAPLAHAEADATVSASNLTISLTDLKPDDAVAPSLTWLNGESFVSADVRNAGAAQSTSLYSGLFLPSTATATLPIGSVIAVTTGDGPSSSGVTIQGRVYSLDGSWSSMSGFAGPVSSGVLTLSPQTQVTFSLDVSLHVVTTVGLDSFGSEDASAFTSLFLTVSGSPTTYGTGKELIAAYTQMPDTLHRMHSFGEDLQYTGTLSFTYQNTTDLSQQALFSWQSGVLGFSYSSPVPEPETSVLLLAGLGAIGFVARRRKA